MKLQLPGRKPASDKARDADAQALNEAAERVELSGDPGRIARFGILFLIVGLGGFLLWATLAPLDEGVPATGAVTVYSQRKPIQHPSGGVISKVHVKEAQVVQADQLLIELDATQIQANVDALQKQYYALIAQEARMNAERANLPAVIFPAQLLKAKDNGFASEFTALQAQIFRSRRAAFESEMASLAEGIAGLESQERGLRAQLGGRTAQLDLVNRQLVDTRSLAGEGYVPRNKLYEEERQSLDLTSQVSDLQANLARVASGLGELKSRREQRRQEYLRDTEMQLADTRNQLATVTEKLRAAEVDLDRTRIRAPVAGTVVGLQIQSVGGVIAPGMRIMDIVPQDETLILEVQVPTHLVDRVQAGMPADLRFQTFQDLPNLVLEGKVLSISADRITDPNTHVAYYLCRIEVLPEGLRKLGNRNLQAGMPVDAMIKTGERSLLQYLLRPLIRRVSQSLTEH